MNDIIAINVITLHNGVFQENNLYLSTNEATDETVITAAKHKFKTVAQSINPDLSDEDIQTYLDKGSYDNGNGKEVTYTWPRIIDFIP